jgi:hypothetical protein
VRIDPQPFTLGIAGNDRSVERPWLVLGKGPSSAKYDPSLADTHNVMALNHAMRGARALVGHAIDIEVFEHLNAADLAGIEYLCVPWVPHVRQKRPFYGGKSFFGPGSRSLDQCCAENPLLQEYADRGRLLSYNLSSAPPSRRHPGLALVTGHSFSAAIVIRLLAQSGARVVRTLGIDGGSAYGASFADLESKTKLQTGQTSYDSQFQEIADTMNAFDLTCGPLDSDVPARIFVGCMPEQDLAFRVLAYSIKRHASISTVVERLDEAVSRAGIHVPTPADAKNTGRTPFSFQRFAIPALRHYQGRAVYVDSDMLVLNDCRGLWNFDMRDRQMLSVAQPAGSGRRPQFSVMLIDCERLRWDVAELVARLDEDTYTYEQLMYEMKSVQDWEAALPETWNSLERYVPNETCLVHFTDMDTQPWLNPLHPLGPLWCGYLLRAVEEGAIDRGYVKAEVDAGNVRPSLLAQIERGEPDPRRLPFGTLRRDLVDFFPPHRRTGHRLSRWKHEAYRTRALATHAIHGVVDPTIRRTRRLASSLISAITPR